MLKDPVNVSDIVPYGSGLSYLSRLPSTPHGSEATVAAACNGTYFIIPGMLQHID